MVIYVSHKRKSDFEKELYAPIRNSKMFGRHKFIFPHEDNQNFDSSNIILNKKIDMIIADVSYPATGQGIELGWAFIKHIPIICIYKSGSDIARSLQSITDKFIEYSDSEDMVSKLLEEIDG